MAESRITDYDGNIVTYWYVPHEDETKKITVTEHVYKFIGKLIMHIPKKNYKTVRYYGAYAATVSKKYEGLVPKEFTSLELDTSYLLRDWRLSIIYNFNNDPLECECGSIMRRTYACSLKPKGGGVIHEIYYEGQSKYVPQGWEQRTGYCPHN